MPDSGAISLGGGGGGGGGIDQLTGDVTAGPGTGSQAATLAAVGTAGTVGDAGHYPVITTDAKGRVTAVTAQAVPADVPLATVTAAGDLIVGSGAGAVTRLPIGADGDVLTVAAGALGYAAPSGGGPDLLQFFASTLPGNSSWAAVAYGGGAFVAVGFNSTAAYSTDGGVTWTASVTPNATGYDAIAFGGGAFVAVRGGSTAGAYSTNGGVTWTAVVMPSANGYNAIAYGGGSFVAVSNGFNTTAHSTNGGVTWTAGTAPNAGGYAAITYGGTAFVAVSGASTAGAYSTNGGVTWTAVVTPFANGCWDIAFGGGTFVVIEAVVGLNAAYSTNNGVAWTVGTALTQPSTGSSTYHQFETIAYGNSTFVAFGFSTNTAVFSTDGGATWQTATAPTGLAQAGHNAMTFGGGVFVGVSSISAGGTFSKIATIAGPGSPSLSYPVVTSGTVFQPSATTNSTVYFQIDAAAAGTYTLTMGPSTAGTDYTVASAVNMVAGSDALVTLVVPMGWNVVLTLVTVTLGANFVVAM